VPGAECLPRDDLPSWSSARAQTQAAAPGIGEALAEAEREAVLAELHSERFVDCSPAQVWATLLDEGRYLASPRTMYRGGDAVASGPGGVHLR
jgi:hypothetical protein